MFKERTVARILKGSFSEMVMTSASRCIHVPERSWPQRIAARTISNTCTDSVSNFLSIVIVNFSTDHEKDFTVHKVYFFIAALELFFAFAKYQTYLYISF